MNLEGKIICAHRGYFDKECRKTYRENSTDLCEAASKKEYIQAIELDVRKSKDGILYCYHGTFMQFFFLLKVRRSFTDIKRRYHVDALSEVLRVISEDKMISLDLQDTFITKADILTAIGDQQFKEVILASPSVSFLERFYDMPRNFVKFMIRNPFAPLYDLKKLKEKNYKYYEVVFPFQVTKSVAERAARHGLGFSCQALFFLSKRSYWKKIEAYNIQWISSDFIESTISPTSIYGA